MAKIEQSWFRKTAAILALVLLAGGITRLVHAENRRSLYVYLRTKLSSRELQEQLNTRLSGVEVTVFGRFRDFEQAVKSQPPDAVLALGPVLDHFGLESALRGQTETREDEAFVLLSPSSGVTLSEAAKMRIAAVDLLGRRGTTQWVGDLLQAPTKPKVVRVARPEDLLPLLSMDVTDLLLVSERMSKELKRISRRSLYATPVRRVGLARLAAVENGDVSSVAMQLRKLDRGFNKILGVSTWR